MVSPNMEEEAITPGLHVPQMHRTTASSGTANLIAVEFSHKTKEVSAFRQVVGMASVIDVQNINEALGPNKLQPLPPPAQWRDVSAFAFLVLGRDRKRFLRSTGYASWI
jgi:hypothetical protein